MCGIVAANVSPLPTGASVDHRGIRSNTVEVAGVTLRHSRLPIVGIEERYDQPVHVGKCTVAFVGEILNFKEFRPGSECDLPLVVEAWERAQGRWFGRFDGFWSVVAIDHDTGRIDVFCDYLAQKPMYYRSNVDVVGVGSEPAAVAALGPTTPDEVYLSSVIKWGYCPDVRRTPYEEIKRVLPGEHVVLETRRGVLRFAGPDYVRRTVIDPVIPRSCTPYLLKNAIARATELRVKTDVSVAALVSGGVDSAIVYHLATQYADIDQAVFVDAGTGDFDGSESEAARAVVGPDLLTVIPLPDEPPSIEKMLRYMQEPIDLGSLAPQVALSDAVGKTGHRVCLTGDGADELFGGYGRSERYDSQASDVWHELVAWHLPRLDRVMMRNRIEVRSPFLARQVVEMAFGLSRDIRTGKKILRDLFRDDLAPGIADRPKVPLRTKDVERDREANSARLVEEFRRMTW